MTPNYDTQENRDYWRFVYETAIKVAAWPAHRRGYVDMSEDVARCKLRLRELDGIENGCIWLTK